MHLHANVDRHKIDMSQGNSRASTPRDQRESATVLCSSPVAGSVNSRFGGSDRVTSDGSEGSVAASGLQSSPVIVRQPVLPDHLKAHSTRYAADFQFPTGDRSAEEETYCSVDDAQSTLEDEDEEEMYLAQQLSAYEVVPDLAVDSIDFRVHSKDRQSADIKTTDFPLTSSGSGEGGFLDATATISSSKASAVDVGVSGDQKVPSLDLPQFPHHMHLEVHGDEIKTASMSNDLDTKAVHPRASAAHKAHVICVSSDHQLLKVRAKKPDATSPGANPQALKRVWSGPLPMTREMEERIESLGPALPNSQKAILWIGIVLDIFTKLSILRQMGKFAKYQDWTSFCIALTFFVFSGGCVAVYWWTHYPVEVLDAPGSPSVRRQASGVRLLSNQAASDAHVRVYGVSKTDVKRIIRALGSTCAVMQLGTAFLATRALFSSETRQRTVAYDLRGMRLVDTIFLTLILCLMQFFIGIRCAAPYANCHGSTGFSFWLIISIIASLCSSALSYTALDFNDIRIEYDLRHQIESLIFFLARLMELAARVQLLALFAAVLQGQFFTVVCCHVVIVLLTLRFCPHPRRKIVWEKFSTTVDVNIGGFTFKLPQANDVKLLVACMAWPPSCFVSDATGKSGRFWWRDRMVARRPFWNLTLSGALIPWPAYMVIMSAEAAVMMSILYNMVKQGGKNAWIQQHFMISVVLHMLWLMTAGIWAATVHMAAAAASPEDIGRAMARKQIESFKDVERMASAKRTGGGEVDIRSHSIASVVISMEDNNKEPTYIPGPTNQLMELRGGYSTLPQHYKMPPIRSRHNSPPRTPSPQRSPPDHRPHTPSISSPTELRMPSPPPRSALTRHPSDHPVTAEIFPPARTMSDRPAEQHLATTHHLHTFLPPRAASHSNVGQREGDNPVYQQAPQQQRQQGVGSLGGAAGDVPAGMTMEAFSRLGIHARDHNSLGQTRFGVRIHTD